MENTATQSSVRTLKGTVVSDAMDKTIVVRVERTKMNQKYKKRYTVSKKYKAHDEENMFNVGDEVTIRACRPMSRDKRWRVVSGRAGSGFAGKSTADKSESTETNE